MLLCFFPGTVSAGKITQGSGTGVILKGDVEGARNRAFDKALRNAIRESVYGVFDSKEPAGMDQAVEKILSTDPFYYIEWYRFVLDDREGNLYKVEVEASVSENKIKRRLSDIGLIRNHEAIRLGILIAAGMESNSLIALFPGGGEDLTGFAAQQYRAMGFQVVDAPVSVDDTPESFEKLRENNQLTAIQGRRIGGDVVVLGQVKISMKDKREDMQQARGYHVDIWVRAVRSRDAALLGLKEERFTLEQNLPGPMLRQQVYQHLDALLVSLGKNIRENAKQGN